MAAQAGYAAVVSHRSGETEDATIADLAVGHRGRPDQDRSLSRSDRVPSTTSCCASRPSSGARREVRRMSRRFRSLPSVRAASALQNEDHPACGPLVVLLVLLAVPALGLDQGGMRESGSCAPKCREQTAKRTTSCERNRTAEAEVQDLKEGSGRRRTRAHRLGMVGTARPSIQVVQPEAANAA